MAREFTPPEFFGYSEPEEIQQRMMDALPEGIDDMPGGFPYDFTMPTAIEKSELIQLHLTRVMMLMYPQYAWGTWLDLHAEAAGITRRPAGYASGSVTVKGTEGTVIPQGTIFCTEATDTSSSLEYATDQEAVIPGEGTVNIGVTAVNPGRESNTKANTVIFSLTNIKGFSSVTNHDDITGGTDAENDASLLERIEEENFREGASFVGNDSDYIRWSKEIVGIGDCIVVPAWNGPGTVKLILVDANGVPANERLIKEVYDHIVSPDDRSKRLLPTACADLTIEAATTKKISYKCTGLSYNDTTDIPTIIEKFKELVAKEYQEAKKEGILIYNQVRPLVTDIPGVNDFDEFLMNGAEENIVLSLEEYAATDTVDFS